MPFIDAFRIPNILLGSDVAGVELRCALEERRLLGTNLLVSERERSLLSAAKVGLLEATALLDELPVRVKEERPRSLSWPYQFTERDQFSSSLHFRLFQRTWTTFCWSCLAFELPIEILNHGNKKFIQVIKTYSKCWAGKKVIQV